MNGIGQRPEHSMHPLPPPILSQQLLEVFNRLQLFSIQYSGCPCSRAIVEVRGRPRRRRVSESGIISGIESGKMEIPVQEMIIGREGHFVGGFFVGSSTHRPS